MKKIKLNDWATLSVMSKDEYQREYPDEDQEQQSPTTDVDGDGEINPETDVEGDRETSKKLEDILKRMTKGEVRRSDIRDASRLHISERKASEAAKPEATHAAKANGTADEPTQAMERIRGQE